MLKLFNLHVAVEKKRVLKGLSLEIGRGEIHVLMGPNGAGKSTLAHVLMGHPAYEVLEGEAWFEGEDFLALAPEERAQRGLFVSFQHPPEISGVVFTRFLRTAREAVDKARGRDPLTAEAFDTLLAQEGARVGMGAGFAVRGVNEGFSGGEKKRSEMLQMALLEPKLALLDEIDSGLDIDALKLVAENLGRGGERAYLVITHYQRLLHYLPPHFVHVLHDGKIVLSGSQELALDLEAKGYDWLSTR